ncbi:hypothetical protein J1N35_039663 [Gossypium stocksii]|uniref:Uncharacterized protein n=1 Tax=Gossypium stocksii TaxID=47602 RepID=A0A9D3UC61_9ROSI|nr:hypothetical protein J1N35_039663 [Gossypium stocksii]
MHEESREDLNLTRARRVNCGTPFENVWRFVAGGLEALLPLVEFTLFFGGVLAWEK